MRPLRHLRFYFAVGGAYIALIIWLSLTPHPPQLANFPHVDKWEHLGAYGLMMLWFGQLAAQRRLRGNLAVAFIALGIVLELLQGLGGVRDMELGDAAADILGVWMGYMFTRQGGGTLLVRLESFLPF